MTLPLPGRADTAHARVAVSLLFLLAGMAIGTWTARLPAIKSGLGLSDGLLSVGLLGIAAGAIAGMQVVGPLVDRYGASRIMVGSALVQGVVLIFPALMPDLLTLTISLFVFGVVHGTLDVSMNAGAVDVERAAGRRMMSSFHAVYSLGGFAGAVLGGLFAYADLSATLTFLTSGALIAVLAVWAGRWALPARPAATEATDGAGAQRASGTWNGVVFLGVLAFCCLVGEGAAADWSSVYLRDNLAGSAGFAAAGYAAFSIMMTAGRLAGDRLATRFGVVRLVRGCGVLAASGLGVALLIGHPMAGVIGFGCFGAGLSCIVPQVFSAAGHRDPARAGQALARVAGLGYIGFLSGPVLIGGAAELIGLPTALAVPAVLAFFVALAAPALRAPKPRTDPIQA
ncbi:MFS transporter [Streptosporangium sp. KLBMP 9127]|nr:MFS transporter [Streptosporangium sp. KLBMP 9127]